MTIEVAPREPRQREDALTRKRIGLLLGVVAAVALVLLLPDSLAVEGRITAAIAGLMAVWWMTEAIPLAATALLPLVLFPVFGVSDITDAASPYASDIVFLFMGGFMIAIAMQRWNLHRRIALSVVAAVGTSPAMLVAGFMLATGFITMWVSNTATAIMMYPIGLSVLIVLGHVDGRTGTDESAEVAGTDDAVPPSGDEAGSVTGETADDQPPADRAETTGPDTTGPDGAGPDGAGSGRTDPNFPVVLMLGIAYAASIGSIATLIGTPPNALLRGYLAENHDIHIGFGQWMLVGLPLAAVMLVLTWLLLTKVIYPVKGGDSGAGRQVVRQELAKLGPMSRGEWSVLAVFVAAAVSWVLVPLLAQNSAIAEAVPWLERIGDTVIAIGAALLLFLIPVNRRTGTPLLTWDTGAKLPWGILLLFGGGLSLSARFEDSGLSAWIGERVGAFGSIPLWALILLVTAIVLFLTELTSNTATAAVFIPIMGGVAMGLDMNVMTLVVPTAIAATLAFMLPVATPPNAIVFGSGQVRIGQMVRSGFWLNLISLVLIMLAMYGLAGWAFGIVL